MKIIKRINFKNFDYILFLTMAILICVGLYCIRQAYLFSEGKDEIFTKQLMGVALGCVMIIGIMLIDYHIICRLSVILYIGIVAVLALTLKIGTNIRGVKRWITIAGILFQPSEFTKIVLILLLAFLCQHFKEKLNKFYVLFILAAVVALPTLLILLEPHLSSSVAILFIVCVIIYSSGISYKVIGSAFALLIPVVLIVIISVTQFNVDLPFIQEYQIKRVLTFKSTDESDNLAGKYQQNQAIEAIMSGGISGKLMSGENIDREFDGIYANESDFIFSIVGEEFGFIGSCIIILLFSLLVIKCLIVAARAPDYTGRLICIGVSAYLMFQSFVNVGVATSLLPNTGLPLPFISYGLTSLVSTMAAVGLVLNIGLRRVEKKL